MTNFNFSFCSSTSFWLPFKIIFSMRCLGIAIVSGTKFQIIVNVSILIKVYRAKTLPSPMCSDKNGKDLVVINALNAKRIKVQ